MEPPQHAYVGMMYGPDHDYPRPYTLVENPLLPEGYSTSMSDQERQVAREAMDFDTAEAYNVAIEALVGRLQQIRLDSQWLDDHPTEPLADSEDDDLREYADDREGQRRWLDWALEQTRDWLKEMREGRADIMETSAGYSEDGRLKPSGLRRMKKLAAAASRHALRYASDDYSEAQTALRDAEGTIRAVREEVTITEDIAKLDSLLKGLANTRSSAELSSYRADSERDEERDLSSDEPDEYE